MQRRQPGFLGVFAFRNTLPPLPAALEAAAVVVAVMGFGLGWAWLAGPTRPADPRTDATWSTDAAYPSLAMSESDSSGSRPRATAVSAPTQAVEAWLVDGFNLLHTVLLGGEERSRWWTAAGRSRVLEAVADATHERDHARVWVVFDGSRPAPPSPDGDAGRLHAVFAPSADDWLVRRVREAASPDRVVVVTADRKLANRARHHGASVMTPVDFLARETAIAEGARDPSAPKDA